MKNLRLVVLAIVAASTLSGCAVNRNASDFEVCKALSGDTFYSAGDAAQIVQERTQAGTMSISPAQCYQIAQNTSAQWAATSANLNNVAVQQQQLQIQQQQANAEAAAVAAASRPVSTTCSAFGNTVNCNSF